MIRVAMSKDSPDKFITEKGKQDMKKTNLSKVGVASEEDQKNYNPNLKIRG